jgi:hypothetical protein
MTSLSGVPRGTLQAAGSQNRPDKFFFISSKTASFLESLANPVSTQIKMLLNKDSSLK